MKTNKVYIAYIKNVFNSAPKKTTADKHDMSIQALQYIIGKNMEDIEKEAKTYREKLLIKHKYQYVKATTDDEKYSLVQSLIWDGFTYRSIEEITGINPTKIVRLLSSYEIGGGKHKAQIRKKTLNLFRT